MNKENKKVEVNEETGEVKEFKEEVKKEEFLTNPGTNIKKVLKWKWEEATKQMVPYYDDEVLDLYKMIQASAPSCDIVAIYNRALLGDTTRINFADPGMYNWGDSDVSDVPTDINSYNELRKITVDSFDTLDPSIKAIFENNFEVFSQAIQDGTYTDIINKSLSANKVEEKQEGKKESE